LRRAVVIRGPVMAYPVDEEKGMERLHRRGCTRTAVMAVMVVLVALACGSPGRATIRYGSLVLGERAFNYRHGVESFRLANGLVVALLPDGHANLVSVDVRYRVGAANDPAGKAGLAHLVEHLTFERRSDPGGPTLDNLLALAALSRNASTTWNATHYHQVALADKLDELLALEAVRMTGGCAGLDQATLDHERAIVAQENAQRGSQSLIHAVLGDVFGAGHRYATGVGGDDITGLTLSDVCGFLEAHYTPDQAIVVIAGRFDPRAIRGAVTERFAGIPRRVTASRSATRQLRLTGTTSTHHADADDASAIVLFAAAPWGSPASFDDDMVDHLMVSRLLQLDRDERWVTGVDAGQLGGQLDGVRYFSLSVADPARLDDAIAQLFRIAGELPGDDSGLELGVIAARRRASLFSAFESVFARGEHCADYLQFTHHGSFHLPELAALQDIETDRLLQRAKRLTRIFSHVVKVLPSKAPATHRTARSTLTPVALVHAPVWQAPVDPAEADRPLILPEQRRAPAVTELRLPNGLRVVMASEFRQPMVEARLVFPVGAFNAGSAAPMLVEAAASLLEHDPRVTLKDFTVIDWAMRLGSQLSVEVDETTTFTVRGTSTFADWHLWRLHWLLENGVYDGDDVERARQAAVERASRRSTGAQWQRAMSQALFGRDHPYARDTGAPAIRTEALEDLRDTYYRANGATLIIVGQFDTTAMAKTVTELFGAWSGERPPQVTAVPAMRPRGGPTWLAHDEPDARQVRITLAFAATSPREASRGTRAIVAEMLRSRLEEVRTRLAASYGLVTAYATSDAGDVLEVRGLIDADRAGEVMRLIQRQLDGLRTGDDDFVANFVRARRTTLARVLADPVTSSTVADELETAVTRGRPIAASATLAAAVAATTIREARAAIAADLKPERMVGVLGGRSADVAAAFAAAGITGIVAIQGVAAR
jgi:zinc protease